MITPLCRFTYCNVFEPQANKSGQLKYSAGLMFPKSDPASIAKVKAEIDKAQALGITKGIFNEAATKSRTFRYPLRDGDDYYAEKPEASREGYRGMMFVSASNGSPIGVVDQYARPLMSQDDFYSGCWGLADVTFKAFNKGGGIGIGVYLNNVMKKKDDERLDGRQSATSAFAGFADNADGDQEDQLQ